MQRKIFIVHLEQFARIVKRVISIANHKVNFAQSKLIKLVSGFYREILFNLNVNEKCKH